MLMLCFQVGLEQSLIVLIYIARVRNNLPRRIYKKKVAYLNLALESSLAYMLFEISAGLGFF